jgi:hypothetical protein
MDPWNALSAAASIAQFIEFGVNLVSKANEIREEGSPLNIKHLKKITSDLVGFERLFTKSQEARGRPKRQRPGRGKNSSTEDVINDL